MLRRSPTTSRRSLARPFEYRHDNGSAPSSPAAPTIAVGHRFMNPPFPFEEGLYDFYRFISQLAKKIATFAQLWLWFRFGLPHRMKRESGENPEQYSLLYVPSFGRSRLPHSLPLVSIPGRRGERDESEDLP